MCNTDSESVSYDRWGIYQLYPQNPKLVCLFVRLIVERLLHDVNRGATELKTVGVSDIEGSSD